MNYIKEMNAFHQRNELDPLSGSAKILWYTLMNINNKTMWSRTFVAAGPALIFKSGLTESSFKRARIELKEKGYIDYQSRDKNQAPVYRMISLVLEIIQGVDQRKDQDMNQQAAPFVNQKETNNKDTNPHMDCLANQDANRDTDAHMDCQAAPLIKQKKDLKQNETKTKDTAATTDAFVFYQENFGVISPFVTEALMNWVNDVGEDLVLDAMKRALEQGKTTWGYVKGILQAWANKGITSVEAAKAEQTEFRQSKHKREYSHASEAEEVVPDWFIEQKRKEKLKREQKQAEEELQDPEAEYAEVARMLAAYKSGRSVS